MRLCGNDAPATGESVRATAEGRLPGVAVYSRFRPGGVGRVVAVTVGRLTDTGHPRVNRLRTFEYPNSCTHPAPQFL